MSKCDRDWGWCSAGSAALSCSFFHTCSLMSSTKNRKQRAPTLFPLNFSTFFAAKAMDDLSLYSSSVPRSGEFWVSFSISLETSPPFPRMWWVLQHSLFSPPGGLCCVTATFNFCKPTACLPVPKTGNVFLLVFQPWLDSGWWKRVEIFICQTLGTICSSLFVDF